MSFIKTRYLIFTMLMTVVLCCPVKALDISIKTSPQGASQTSELRLDTAKIVGVSRKKAQELLGQPKRSEEFFPYSHHSIVVDYYDVAANTNEHLRLSFDKNNDVAAADVEQSPYAIPKFMGEKVNSIKLTDTELRIFLHGTQEDKIRNMSADQITEKLGKPDRTWHETSRAGGRDWHFLNFLYYLSKNGRKGFIVMFNEASNSVYEYRLQSISD
ncbi:MAG: hypothetical protein P4L53_22615 [Candidatus Obscuribacterales bacterium]|nr:hypothetical protein [Candidatus Obscuribacterales bacterium]